MSGLKVELVWRYDWDLASTYVLRPLLCTLLISQYFGRPEVRGVRPRSDNVGGADVGVGSRIKGSRSERDQRCWGQRLEMETETRTTEIIVKSRRSQM